MDRVFSSAFITCICLICWPTPGTAQFGCPGQLPEGEAPRAYTSPPILRDPGGTKLLIDDSYPPALRRNGVHGLVRVWALINRVGLVDTTFVSESSGIPALDSAAVEVASALAFHPAYLDRDPICKWVKFPIIYEPISPRSRSSNLHGGV